MSNPYENHPGKGFKYIPGYEPPAGTQAAEEKRRLEEDKRRKQKENSDAINDARRRQSEAERARKKAATQKTKKAEKSNRSKANKDDELFSETAATITFVIVGFYTYAEWNYEIFQTFITALISALIVGYTIKIIFTLLIIGFFAYLIAEYNGYVYEAWLGEVIEMVIDNIVAFIDHLSELGTRE